MIQSSSIVLLLIISAGLGSTNCATRPQSISPLKNFEVPKEWTGKTILTDQVNAEWWTTFGDPELTDVIGTAIAHNYDLQAATARLDQAAATARIAGADLYPTITIGLNGAKRRQNFIGLPIPGRQDGDADGTDGRPVVDIHAGALTESQP